jgi:hypothetical protein
MANPRRYSRNRKGCIIILALVGGILLLSLLVGLHSQSQNSVATKIPALPADHR